MNVVLVKARDHMVNVRSVEENKTIFYPLAAITTCDNWQTHPVFTAQADIGRIRSSK